MYWWCKSKDDLHLQAYRHYAIKDPHRYDVQGSDTTMMTREPAARAIKKWMS